MDSAQIKKQYGVTLTAQQAAAIRSIQVDPSDKTKRGAVALKYGHGAHKQSIDRAFERAGYTAVWVAGDLPK